MFESIRMNAEIGALWRPPEPLRKRVLARFPFAVFYTVRPAAIVVEAVAHGARRPGYWIAVASAVPQGHKVENARRFVSPCRPRMGRRTWARGLGRFAIDMRLLPFSGTLESAMDKVRGALSTSAQRELINRLSELSFHGVPSLPSRKEVRAALERAWFEQQALKIVYVDGNFIETTRTIRLVSVAMDRHETRIDAIDSTTQERRQFRLDRIVRAEVCHAPRQ